MFSEPGRGREWASCHWIGGLSFIFSGVWGPRGQPLGTNLSREQASCLLHVPGAAAPGCSGRGGSWGSTCFLCRFAGRPSVLMSSLRPLSEVPGALAVEKVPIRRSWLALCFLYSALPSRLQPSASQLLRFCCCCC